MEKSCKSTGRFKRVLFSEMMQNCTPTQKIAYIAIMTALTVICNMFFEFKLADTQFSLTLFFSALTGIIIGPIFGFVASFLGDLVGFLYNSGGFMYMPWIGLSMGLVSLIAGFIVNGFTFGFKGEKYVKLALVSLLTFLCCTVAVNTTAFWIIYNDRKVSYFTYLVARLFVQGQIWNSLVNYLLLFLLYPLILRIKTLLEKRR
ncbi:MAG: ECF transporter S component [Clostridia bacterium]|nr:ECF transporter S component [Clostridia bacterium]